MSITAEQVLSSNHNYGNLTNPITDITTGVFSEGGNNPDYNSLNYALPDYANVSWSFKCSFSSPLAKTRLTISFLFVSRVN